MRILVTGGAGYLGSRLLPDLCRLGADVDSIDWDHDKVSTGGSIRLRTSRADVRFWEPPPLTEAYDVCIHLAALTGIRECAASPVRAHETNVLAIRRGLNQWGATRHIVISTGGVYGAQKGVLTEEDDTLPEDVYCETKARAEDEGLRAGNACVLRLNHLTGISPKMRWREIGNNLARDAAAGSVNIYDPDLSRPYLHVKDASKIISTVAMMSDESFPYGGLFNVVAENKTKRDIGRVLGQITDAAIRFEQRDLDRWDYRLSSEKMRNQLGIGPERTLADALEEVVVECQI